MAAVEWMAVLFGLAGTVLLASRSRWAGWGFVSYLISNLLWIGYALAHGPVSLLVQQLGFTVASCWGIWQWQIKGERQ